MVLFEEMTSADLKIVTEIQKGVYLNSACRPMLSENNLNTFDSFLSIAPEEVIKKVRRDRHTVRVKLFKEGKPHEAYMKRATYSWLANLLKGLRKFTRQRGSLVHEYLNLVRLRELGIPSITPVAAGTRRRGLRCDSFLLTESLGPTVKLEDYLPENFGRPFSADQAARKKALVEALARLTRHMHEGGINHRDLYLCHIHVLPQARPWPRLFVIDLNRADRRAHVGWRWRVKDLAALNYSAPPEIFSRTDRIRFLKLYLGTDRLTPTHRRLVRKIVKKTAKIARHALRSKARDSRYIDSCEGASP